MKDKLIVWTILLALMVLSIVPGFAQVDVTSNLVNNSQTANTVTGTWQNAVFQNSLTCWARGDPGYCGPNPIVNPNTGSVNFSYGLVDLHQFANVAKALPNSGAGLITTGFLFTWQSKNGNGWDDGRLDKLDAYVKLYSSNNSTVLENLNYNLNFLHSWTTFTWSQNWSKDRRPNELGNVRYGFIGMDNNYWAGPYGPEVVNINFQLKYKPDPCKNNPLYSPDCPNFTKELAEKTATPSTDTSYNKPPPDSQQSANTQTDGTEFVKKQEFHEFVEKDEMVDDSYSQDILSTRLESALVKIFDDQSKDEQAALDVATTAVEKAEKIAGDNVRQAEQRVRDDVKKTVDQFQENNQQQTEAIQEVKQNTQASQDSMFHAADSSSGSITVFQLPGPQTSSVISILQEPTKQTNEHNVNNQQQLLSQTTQSIVKNTAIQATTNTSTITETVKPASNIQVQTATSSTIFIAPTPPQTTIVEQQSIQTIQQSANRIEQQPVVANTSQQIASISQTQQLVVVPPQQVLQELPQPTSNFLTNRADPINEIIEQKPQLNTDSRSNSKQESVKSNVENSSLAGNVKLETLQVLPVGFNAYTIALADASFYQPREIYRNQRTIDNRRALQNLRSDQLHEQLINQQWR